MYEHDARSHRRRGLGRAALPVDLGECGCIRSWWMQIDADGLGGSCSCCTASPNPPALPLAAPHPSSPGPSKLLARLRLHHPSSSLPTGHTREPAVPRRPRHDAQRATHRLKYSVSTAAPNTHRCDSRGARRCCTFEDGLRRRFSASETQTPTSTPTQRNADADAAADDGTTPFVHRLCLTSTSPRPPARPPASLPASPATETLCGRYRRGGPDELG